MPKPVHPSPCEPGPLAPSRADATAPRAESATSPVLPAGSAGMGVRPRIRVLCGGEIALGPGKVALLAAIAERQCLADAARALGMSYMRAWKLLQTMNACFHEPLVTTHRGGRMHGSAALTPTGQRALDLYRCMEQASLDALSPSWEELRGLLCQPLPG